MAMMLPRRTNLALGGLLVAAVATGLWANLVAGARPFHPAVLHGLVGAAIVVLVPWKQAIARRGVARGRRSRWVGLALAVLVSTALASGLLHATDLTDRLGPVTVMQVHVVAGLLALAVVVAHWRAHPVRPRRTDADRRALLQAGGLLAVSGAALVAWEGALGLVGAAGADRRHTGSHERGSGDPSAMPVTSWLFDTAPRVDPSAWTVQVAGRRLVLADLADLPHDDVDAVLDCTSGWWSRQTWSGVRLDHLLGEVAAPGVEVTSLTGYSRILPADGLDRLWLCTHVGGRPLSRGHGAPARLVAPDRRGFWWVKWVASITPTDRPAWAQPPFPMR